jgi:hypothetical protein
MSRLQLKRYRDVVTFSSTDPVPGFETVSKPDLLELIEDILKNKQVLDFPAECELSDVKACHSLEWFNSRGAVGVKYLVKAKARDSGIYSKPNTHQTFVTRVVYLVCPTCGHRARLSEATLGFRFQDLNKNPIELRCKKCLETMSTSSTLEYTFVLGFELTPASDDGDVDEIHSQKGPETEQYSSVRVCLYGKRAISVFGVTPFDTLLEEDKGRKVRDILEAVLNHDMDWVLLKTGSDGPVFVETVSPEGSLDREEYSYPS